jgi:hypothetical protein
LKKLSLALCLLAGLSFGQSFTGSIRGTVTDSTQAAVPNAKVVATDVDRKVEYRTQADASGRYILPSLPTASYVLAVEAPGFRKFTRAAFRLEVQAQATVDIALTVGDVTTTVDVEASAPLLNTTSAALGQVIENKTIMSMPISGRNPLSLVALAPGITGSTGGTSFISNGVRNNSAEVMLDGAALTGIEQNGGVNEVKFNATVDVIQEFKVQTNYFSAEYGNSGGTIINMVSKSGTNQVHGVGYYFRTDSNMNANNWFSNSRGGTLVDSKRDNFGATVGGPVYLPKLYSGKNRTFFFGDYDRVKNLSATSQTGSVPTARQLLGDFSDTRNANGSLSQLYDPFNTILDASGATMRLPIAGNIIPMSRQNPIARAFNKYYPAENRPGNAFTRIDNWFAQGSTPSASNRADIKIDHNISEKQRISSRYGANWGWNGFANLTGNISHSATPGKNRNQNFTIDYTRSHNPNTVMTARAGVLRVASVRDPISYGFDAVKELGVNPLIHASGVKAFPLYNTGYRSMGAAGFGIIHRYEDTFQFSGAITRIQGGHTIKAGAEFRLYHENYFQPDTPNGSFTFSRNQTAQNPLVASSSQGDGLASAFLGFGSGGTLSINHSTAQTAGYFGTFVNDDWRITNRLTLNLGVRYDFDIPRTDRFNRMNWLDLEAPAPVVADNPALKALYGDRLRGMMRFTDENKRTLYNGDWNNVQPRVGIAFALNNKTSIRAGYGVFYTISRHTVKGEIGNAFQAGSGIQWSLDSGRTQFATWENPWPVGLTTPPGRNAAWFLGQGAGTPSPVDDNPHYQQWNFSVQREVPGSGVIEANYVGTKGTHLYFGQGDVVSNLNPLYNNYWGIGRNALTANVTNPFYGVITNPLATAYNQPTIQLNRLLRPFAAYTSVGGYRASRNIANSTYHALQLKYEKRFSKGLSVIAHYTISKMMSDSDVSGSDVEWLPGGSSIQDYQNLRNEKSLSGFDVPQRFVGSFDYQLPIGRGRALGKSMNRVLDGVIGGWELSGIISAQSRTPLGITQSASTLWQGNQRPNLIGDPSKPGSVRDKLNSYFNVAAFSAVPADTLGSTPRYLANYRGPNLINEDVTLMKNFRVTEAKSLQLRLEMYSATNSPQWGTPNTSFGGNTFGQITSTTGQRSVQVAVKFYY